MRIKPDHLSRLYQAARDTCPVSGLTHCFYRYPARFSPTFVRMAIECFSTPGDLVLDPYMGGGTTVVEALALGRRVVGNDLNSLAAFVATVKTTPLVAREIRAIRHWATHVVPSLSYRTPRSDLTVVINDPRTKNLTLPKARFIRKVIAAALVTISALPTRSSRDFAKCVVLQVGQWALDGRKRHTTLAEFRLRLSDEADAMLASLLLFAKAVQRSGRTPKPTPIIGNVDASIIDTLPTFAQDRERATLVVTSPPYPGVHMLYHRWQVDGRKETPAPYWITGCNDGQGAAFYNFGDRRDRTCRDYFAASLRTLQAIRRTMAPCGVIIQTLAFNDPDTQLPRYLENMERAGFEELLSTGARIWREVPNRRWHATAKGMINSSREVVLLHMAD